MKFPVAMLVCLCASLVVTEGRAVDKAKSQECTPNTTFETDCKTCQCSADGTILFCTQTSCNSSWFWSLIASAFQPMGFRAHRA